MEVVDEMTVRVAGRPTENDRDRELL